MLRAYRYRLFPSQEHAERLNQWFGCCRFVFNEALAYRKALYQSQKKSLSRYELDRRLPALKQQFPFLKDAYSQCLQQALAHLEAA